MECVCAVPLVCLGSELLSSDSPAVVPLSTLVSPSVCPALCPELVSAKRADGKNVT